MICATDCTSLAAALEKLKDIVLADRDRGCRTVIFCEDRLTLAAERTVCAAVGGTFTVSVYTFARFLASESGRKADLLTSQGSAMAIRAIIERLSGGGKLRLFGRCSPSSAAGAVYDTVSLLYSSGMSAAEAGAIAASGLLGDKLHDIALIWAEYESYLAESGKTDRNAYIASLPAVIRTSKKIPGSTVVFLGFQAFTRSSLECVKAAFGCAGSVHGLFIGGDSAFYVNEGRVQFMGAAGAFGGSRYEKKETVYNLSAERLRRGLFDPESYFSDDSPVCTDVRIYQTADETEELEFIAADIRRRVSGGERYAKISVMLPDLDAAERDLSRIFGEYGIPYYADRQYALSEHAISEFVISWLLCAASGCRFEDSDRIIASPLFPASRADKDEYRNYALRHAKFRAGIKREADRESAEAGGYDYEAVCRVRTLFLKGLSCIPPRGSGYDYCEGLKKLMSVYGCADVLKEMSAKFADTLPAEAQFCGRAADAMTAVLTEAESIAGGEMPVIEFIKILKSGLSAYKISLIPPKADAVYVSGLTASFNTGSNAVYAARLTGSVPSAVSDTALLSDGEIAFLNGAGLEIAPKICEVNARTRELCALNVCAFKKELVLTCPVRLNGEEEGVSEMISYAGALLASPDGSPLKAMNAARARRLPALFPYACGMPLPAARLMIRSEKPDTRGAVFEVLCERGYGELAARAAGTDTVREIGGAKELYAPRGTVSPTALETYFACPCRAFLQQGLRLREREEGAMRPVDTGNFVHEVLQTLAPEINGLPDRESAVRRSREIAGQLLKKTPYSSLLRSKKGEYTAADLIWEASEISAGMFEQVKNSSFEVAETEYVCCIPLSDGLALSGRIDRVDRCGDMVRVIDYKTGVVDSSAGKYYTGRKLQLPLYLLAASEGSRPVGAYYFPASVAYREEDGGVFRLHGYMDGGEEVLQASDSKIKEGEKSDYVPMTAGGRKTDTAMPAPLFAEFLNYSLLVARLGADEMLGGNVAPSPADGICKSCKYGGCCGYSPDRDGEERAFRAVKCSEIAAVSVINGKGEK